MGNAKAHQTNWEAAAKGRACVNCAHYGPPKSDRDQLGTCRKGPPSGVLATLPSQIGGLKISRMGIFPAVERDDYCACYEAGVVLSA